VLYDRRRLGNALVDGWQGAGLHLICEHRSLLHRGQGIGFGAEWTPEGEGDRRREYAPLHVETSSLLVIRPSPGQFYQFRPSGGITFDELTECLDGQRHGRAASISCGAG
jgi:hypothetical protein